MVRRSRLVGGAVVLAVLLAGTVNLSATSRAAVSQAEDPLRGVWDTGPVSMKLVHAVMASHGYTKTEISRFWRRFGLERAKSWEFNLRFYRKRRVAYVTKTGWDPSKGGQPLTGDSGPYDLLPGQRVAIMDQKSTLHRYREVYGYRVSGRTLTLRVISETNPTMTKKELRLDMLFMYAAAAAPFRRV